MKIHQPVRRLLVPVLLFGYSCEAFTSVNHHADSKSSNFVVRDPSRFALYQNGLTSQDTENEPIVDELAAQKKETISDTAEPKSEPTSTARSEEKVETGGERMREEEEEFWPKLQNDLQKRWRIFQETQDMGFNFRVAVACAIAGDDYDHEAIREEINDHIHSNPCVMFTWERSPSCKQAVEAFEMAGAKVKNVRLDDPWDEGNPIRAELGKMVGRSSVPCIFIGGKYVGGYDGGISDDAPGIEQMAFEGTLRPKLKEAGALMESEKDMENDSNSDIMRGPLTAAPDTKTEPATKTLSTGKVNLGAETMVDDEEEFWPKLQKDVQKRWRIFQETQDMGFNFRVAVACAIAGEYDQEAIREEINDYIPSVRHVYMGEISFLQASRGSL